MLTIQVFDEDKSYTDTYISGVRKREQEKGWGGVERWAGHGKTSS